MPARILKYLGDHALAVVALACSLLALAGSSYAAFTISGSQIRNHSIDPVKLNPKLIAGNVRAWALVGPGGRLIAGGGRPRVDLVGSGYGIRWGVRLRRHCSTLATVDPAVSPPTETLTGPVDFGPRSVGYATASSTVAHGIGSSAVQTYNQQGQPTQLGFNIVVVC